MALHAASLVFENPDQTVEMREVDPPATDPTGGAGPHFFDQRRARAPTATPYAGAHEHHRAMPHRAGQPGGERALHRGRQVVDDIEGANDRGTFQRKRTHVRFLEDKIPHAEASGRALARGDFPAAEIATAISATETVCAQPEAEQTEAATEIDHRKGKTFHRRGRRGKNRVAAQLSFDVAPQPRASIIGTGDGGGRVVGVHDKGDR